MVELFALQSTDRTDVRGADRVVVGKGDVFQDVHHGAIAEVENAQLVGATDLAAEAYAAAAQDAAFLVENHARPDVHALL